MIELKLLKFPLGRPCGGNGLPTWDDFGCHFFAMVSEQGATRADFDLLVDIKDKVDAFHYRHDGELHYNPVSIDGAVYRQGHSSTWWVTGTAGHSGVGMVWSSLPEMALHKGPTAINLNDIPTLVLQIQNLAPTRVIAAKVRGNLLAGLIDTDVPQSDTEVVLRLPVGLRRPQRPASPSGAESCKILSLAEYRR